MGRDRAVARLLCLVAFFGGCSMDTAPLRTEAGEIPVVFRFDGQVADGRIYISRPVLDDELMTPDEVARAQEALTELMNVVDGMYGTGPDDTVELPTLASGCEDGDTGDGDACGAITPAGCGTVPGGSEGCQWGDVELRHFFTGYLGNSYVNIDSITPVSGVDTDYAAYDDMTSNALGLSSALGLWRYGTLEPRGQAYDDGVRRWRFRLPPGGGDFSFVGRVFATVHTASNPAPHLASVSTGGDLAPTSTNRIAVSNTGTFAVVERSGQLFRVNRLSGAVTQLPDGTNMVFARNGLYLAYERGGSVYRYYFTTGLERDAYVASGCSARNPAISANGRWIAFESDCVDLCGGADVSTGCVAGRFQVYRRDMQAMTPATYYVGVSVVNGAAGPYGGAGNSNGSLSWSTDPSISDNGTRVSFTSTAPDLVPGGNTASDVFLRDVTAVTTTRVSRDINVKISDDSAIAPNGSFVVFSSTDTQGLTDVNPGRDVFRYVVAGGAVSIVNLDQSGAQPTTGASLVPNATNCLVAFRSKSVLAAADTNALNDVYVRNVCMGTTQLISLNGDGQAGNANSTMPYLSTGVYMSFVTASTNMSADGATAFPTVKVHGYVVKFQ